MSSADFERLVRSLTALESETEWVEFKRNNTDPQTIGENVSAVSNGAALHEKPTGYLVWGIDDSTHQIVGTTFRPQQTKKGNEELESWLLRLLEPRLDVRFHAVNVDQQQVVVCEVPAATSQPTRFSGQEYILVGSYTKPLKDFPEKERKLWQSFNASVFEDGIRACYQHACLMYVSGKRMGNAPLRERLGIKDSNYPMASRIIKDAVKVGLMKPYDGSGIASYLPFWA